MQHPYSISVHNLSKVSYIIKSLRGVLSPFILKSIYFQSLNHY